MMTSAVLRCRRGPRHNDAMSSISFDAAARHRLRRAFEDPFDAGDPASMTAHHTDDADGMDISAPLPPAGAEA